MTTLYFRHVFGAAAVAVVFVALPGYLLDIEEVADPLAALVFFVVWLMIVGSHEQLRDSRNAERESQARYSSRR
jgi:L-asparagine transporter-like permease